MTYFFSPSTKGFYISGVHSVIPSDANSMTKAEYDAVISGLQSGNVLQVTNGNATTTPLVQVVTWDMVRKKRDSLISLTDWSQMPDVNLTSEKKTAWLTYRQQLRDIPSQTVEPKDVVWPTSP